MVKVIKKGQSTPHKQLTKTQRQLVIDNIPYAKKIAHTYAGAVKNTDITMMQLETESCSALCEAALRYNPKKNADFTTYAFNWCKKFILAEINDWGYSGDVDLENIQEEIPEEVQVQQNDTSKRIETMFSVLNAQELKVIRLIFGFDGEVSNFKETALKMHMSTSNVHHIYEQAMTKMELSENHNF